MELSAKRARRVITVSDVSTWGRCADCLDLIWVLHQDKSWWSCGCRCGANFIKLGVKEFGNWDESATETDLQLLLDAEYNV